MASSENSKSENSKKGQYKRLLDGKTITAPPMGYKIEQIAPRTKYSYNTEVRVCPETSVIVQDIFETYANGGHSLKQLSEYLYDKYSIFKAISSLENILSNKFYIGTIVYNDKEFPHIYPRFISEELFNKVQSVKSINNKYFKVKEVFDKKNVAKPKESKNRVNGRLYVVQRGELPGKLPFGYKKIYETINKKKAVVLDKDKVAIIIDAFESYATGNFTLLTLSLYIREKYKIDFHSRFIEVLLKNKFYTGIMKFKGKEYFHGYPRIISDDLFEKCMNMRVFKSRGMNKHRPLIEKKENKYNHLTLIEKILLFCKIAHTIDEIIHEFKVDPDTLRDTLFDLELENKIKEIQPRIWQTL